MDDVEAILRGILDDDIHDQIAGLHRHQAFVHLVEQFDNTQPCLFAALTSEGKIKLMKWGASPRDLIFMLAQIQYNIVLDEYEKRDDK